MGKLAVEKFGLKAIAATVKGSDVSSARVALSFAFGVNVDVSGKVRKVVRHCLTFKLVIEPDDVSGLVVFADCLSDAENLRNHKIRKGSLVAVSGRLQSFGASVVCLSDCYLLQKLQSVKKGKLEQIGTQKNEGREKTERLTQEFSEKKFEKLDTLRSVS